MIVAERREGSLRPLVDKRAGYAPIWRYLDRNVPLGIKLIVPVLGITAIGTLLFGYLIAQQVRVATDAGYIATAHSTAHGAANSFLQTTGETQDLNGRLHDEIADQPDVTGLWIVDYSAPGAPVVASATSTDVGRADILDAHEVAAQKAGLTLDQHERANGQPILETVIPLAGGEYAVVVDTSLRTEEATILQMELWVALAGLAVGTLEVTSVIAILEAGVVRRIRRVNGLISAFGRRGPMLHLSEANEPQGHDVLFNLARDVEIRLTELGERERGGDVLSDLGRLALQGAKASDLTLRALDLTRDAAQLDSCFLVETGGRNVMIASSGASPIETNGSTLPIWLGALVRAAAHSRRAVLADGLGEDCRFWDATTGGSPAQAAFVPLAGTPDPIGVIVGIAMPGTHITAASVALVEGVAASLGESLQRSAADKATHESEVKSKALSTVSHEMRNPLNAMLGFSNLLLTGAAGPLTDKQRSYVGRIDDASKHLLALVNDYLDLARIIAGSMPMHIEAVPIAAEVQAVLGLMEATAASKKVVLRSDIAEGVVARADRTRLRQVLVNLVSNALKFTPAGGYVRIESAGGSNGVRLSVIDTGIGIPADKQHLIFSEFVDLRPGHNGTGAGLGLALTKRFVEGMGGFIRFTSAEGAGTIFDVWLPGENTPQIAEAQEQRATAGVR